MNDPMLDTMTERLGRLERENRRLKAAGVRVPCVGAGRVRMAPDGTSANCTGAGPFFHDPMGLAHTRMASGVGS